MRDLAIAMYAMNPTWPAARIAYELGQLGFVSRSGSPYAATTVRAMLYSNPETIPKNARLRRERVAAARRLGRHTRDEWSDLVAVFMGRCVSCGEAGETKDHIEPLYVGGADSIDNLQPLCGSCNSRRGPIMTDHRQTAETRWTPTEIRRLRGALSETVEAFGGRFGRSGRTVEDWEQGRRRPDVMVLLAMQALARRRKLL